MKKILKRTHNLFSLLFNKKEKKIIKKEDIKREKIKITNNFYLNGHKHIFFDNIEIEFITKDGKYPRGLRINCGNNCVIKYTTSSKINCGNDCNITCGNDCNITCGNDCVIYADEYCNIECGKNCLITCRRNSYIKAGVKSQLIQYRHFLKTISKNEQFICWYVNRHNKLINTFEDVDWKNKNLDKWNEFYAFVNEELDSVTLF